MSKFRTVYVVETPECFAKRQHMMVMLTQEELANMKRENPALIVREADVDKIKLEEIIVKV